MKTSKQLYLESFLVLCWFWMPHSVFTQSAYETASTAPSRSNPDSIFALSTPDTDSYFRDYGPILCDKFTNWVGYSVPEIQEISKRLAIKEQSAWDRWNTDDTWVFLGYRGTTRTWSSIAAEDQYKINPNGEKLYGDGLYMTPNRYIAWEYSILQRERGARVCYNFAPKRVLNQLLFCTRSFVIPFSTWRQCLSRPPMQVSARVSSIGDSKSRIPFSIVYPEQILPFIRVLCVKVPWTGHIPKAFAFNNIYANQHLKELQLHSIK